MKKFLTGMLVLIMVCAMFTACGGNAAPSTTPSSTPSSTPSTTPSAADQDDSDDITAEYEEAMGEFIPAFEELVATLGELLTVSEDISSEDELIQWCDAFLSIKESIGSAVDELANVAAYVPDEYIDSHAAITVAAAAVYDAMTGFENAVAATVSGDAEAFEEGIIEFVGNALAADALWEEAVE